ncbi:MAG: DUF2779 domain-containing protein [Bacteroidota bacterium]
MFISSHAAPLTEAGLIVGQSCRRRLWLRAYEAPGPTAQQHLRRTHQLEMHQMVARHGPPGPDLMALPTAEALRATQEALGREVEAIYGAALTHQGRMVRIDRLRRVEAGWEVASARPVTRLKKRRRRTVQTLALQKWTAVQTGVPITRCVVITLRTEPTASTPDAWLRETDLTHSVDRLLHARLPPLARQLRAVLDGGLPPRRPLVATCRTCEFFQRCWPQVPEVSVLTLPWRTQHAVRDALLEQGVVGLDQVEAPSDLSPRLQRYMQSWQSDAPVIDQGALQAHLRTLAHPVSFLDFEALRPAVPRYDGMRPWEPFPFQYSLHTMDRTGAVAHTGYLHATDTDPRPALAAKIIKDLGTQGSIVVYSSFEAEVIEALMEAIPALQVPLARLLPRLWDLHAVFADEAYLDVRFKGSTSLKRIAPVMAPRFGYHDLAVQDGTEAQLTYRALLNSQGGAHQEHYNALWAYCQRDTWAMVEVLRVLRAVGGMRV